MPAILTSVHLSLAQLRVASAKSLHVFQEPALAALLAATLPEHARAWQFPFAELDGDQLIDKASVLAALARAYSFGNSGIVASQINWDGASDLIGDLHWLLAGSALCGSLLLYRNPKGSLQRVQCSLLRCSMYLAAKRSTMLRQVFLFMLSLGQLAMHVLDSSIFSTLRHM